MKVSKAMTIWIDYHNAHKKKIRYDHICPSLIGSVRISVIVRLIKLPQMRPVPFCTALPTAISHAQNEPAIHACRSFSIVRSGSFNGDIGPFHRFRIRFRRRGTSRCCRPPSFSARCFPDIPFLRRPPIRRHHHAVRILDVPQCLRGDIALLVHGTVAQFFDHFVNLIEILLLEATFDQYIDSHVVLLSHG